MKFLCVPCDSPMKLQAVGPPERGSLSVVYSCPECGYEIAMLTNAYETQIVQSLGVRIRPADGAGDGDRAGTASDASGAAARCPFSAMTPASDGTRPAQADEPVAVRWTPAAEARLPHRSRVRRPPRTTR